MTTASTTETPSADAALNAEIDALLTGRHGDPFHILGPHRVGDRTVVRVFAPNARHVAVVLPDAPDPIPLPHLRDGFFMGEVGDVPLGRPDAYRVRIDWGASAQESADPYAFGPLLGDLDLYLIGEGRHESLADCLGSHVMTLQGETGVRFAVWAPNARRVSVVGDFNSWDGRRHPMRLRHSVGVWELFIPGLQAGERYKYEIIGAGGNLLPLKADPLARQTEMPPATASVVPQPGEFTWTDGEWMAQRAARQAPDAPISVYEVHAGSWLPREGEGDGCVWDRLAERLVPYAKDMGFTHIELLPIMEHPFGGSWGYQPLGVFAPTARYGTPADFARFVDRCHAAGVGVILDWVPAHFPTDTHGLAQFDGTALYEYSDPREGFHPDWNTLIYNLGRTEVRNFMVTSALEWLRRFHVDGLRVDAVASMLYRDYSRAAGQWIPNRYGGRENLEAVEFLRDMNATVAKLCPGAITVAEESTAWPGVSARTEDGGLGFTYKWNMGWMHDTLRYMHHEPVHRRYHHNDMTFGMVYAYSERFILPLSHDEVVHGKGSLLNKMPGDRWQRFANLRAYFGFMWAHPGKKLLFMGGEIAQEREWNHDASIDWPALDDAMHRGVQQLVRDLNNLYRELSPLHRHDADASGFSWVIGDDSANSVFAFMRHDGDARVLAVCNFTPVPRHDYRIGVPRAGWWRERLNTDASDYGGSGVGNGGGRHTDDIPSHGQAQSLSLVLPPLATVIFQQEG
ncbi:1,4-alpha-glucan branching protein GlgB [Bordetella genomosp. 9]|uniref:1,4-alpha-glucan branching enzyme GlgB n=1 Tax=Bordetella genomosp. 9 TaxID=1416803 RepID=A0A1W6YZF1_9BORD|nr:1,4-alpha-glucan branching protein GlgB [Bordetella genomosp. 9]ARP86436.1 1,4-alpha-glucan branching enzyme [Bordetella genomosp. 9]